MTIVDLQNRAQSDGVLVLERNVSIPGPQLLARMETPPYMTIAEIQAHPDQKFEMRNFRYGHLLGPGISAEQIGAWQADWPDHRLPSDLAQLLLNVNGIHLWADLDYGRSYIGIAPITEWVDAATGWWAEFVRPPLSVGLMMSYHQDDNGGVVLDTRSGIYRWFEWEDFEHPQMIGRSVEELLDWLWVETRFDPRDDTGPEQME